MLQVDRDNLLYQKKYFSVKCCFTQYNISNVFVKVGEYVALVEWLLK